LWLLLKEVSGFCCASRDLLLAQRIARHPSPLTAIVYTHVGDEDLKRGVKGLRC
jgi:hypothetical protein